MMSLNDASLEYCQNASLSDRLCLNDFLGEGNWFQSLKFVINVRKEVKPI